MLKLSTLYAKITSFNWFLLTDYSIISNRVLPFWLSNVFDLGLHTVSNTKLLGGASSHDSVGIDILTGVNIALCDGAVVGLVDAAGFHCMEGRLEESLRTMERLFADGDDLAGGKFIKLLKGVGGSISGHFLL